MFSPGPAGRCSPPGSRPVEAALAAASIQAMTAGQYPGPLPPQTIAERMFNVVREIVRNSDGA